MAKTDRSERLMQEMIRLCHSVLDSQALRVGLLDRLQKIVPFDYAYFTATDPATQLGINSVVAEQPPPWLMPIFIENEFLQDDFLKFNSLFNSGHAVGVLSAATGQELERSPRYREMLTPLSMGDELRAVFGTDSACWGTLCLHRGGVKAGYSAAEAAFLAQIAPHAADGLRKAWLLGDAPAGAVSDASGVLILAEDQSVMAMTAAAEHWLAELTETEGGDPALLPLVVRGVVARLKAIEGEASSSCTPKARLHTRSGHWLMVYASRLRTPNSPPQIAVIFEAAQPAEIAPLMMQAYLLTRREGEVTQCVLRGWSTTRIATQLHISANTVQDHLKAIFEKVDVNSRGELAARIFRQQQRP